MHGTTNLHRSAIQAYDALPTPVWLFSVETLQILASNRAAQTWLEYDTQTLQSMTIADLHPEVDRPRIINQVRQFDGTETDAGNWAVVARSGARYIAAITWTRVIFDGAAAIVATLRDTLSMTQAHTTVRPVTGNAEAPPPQIVVTDADFSKLFQAVPGKMLVLTPDDFSIVAVSDEYTQAVFAEREAIIGRQLFDVFPDDPADPKADGVENLMASLQRVRTLHVTDVMGLQRYPIRAPEGVFQERFWLPVNKPVFDPSGRLIYIIHRVEDVSDALASAQSADATSTQQPVTETRTALLALQERETRLQTAETLLEIGSWEHDPDQGTLRWSKRVFDMYGIPPDQEPPNFDSYVAMVHPDDQAQMLATYTDFIDSAAPVIVFQHRIKRPDGTVAHIRGVGARHRVEGREIVIGYAQDITTFIETKERLTDAARLQKRAGYMAQLGGWRVELNPAHITWSPERVAIHDEPEGTAPTLDAAIRYYIPEHRDRIRALLDACIHTGEPFDEVLKIITATGRHAWVRAIGEAVHNEIGQIVAIEGAFQDISELVAARNASSMLSRRLDETLENISDAFFLLDGNWDFSFLNGQAETLLQRRREDLLGKNIWQEFPGALGSRFQTEYERAVTEGHVVRFQEFYSELSSWFEVDAYPTPEGLAVHFRDVTRQRTREEQLHLLETAVSRQNDILLITEAEPIDHPHGPKIIYVNEAFVRRTGFSREEAIGQTPRILQGLNTQRAELDRIRRSLEKWQPVRAELINYTRTGEAFWLELDIVPIANESGWFTHWAAIERDITERKHAQQALQINEERFRLVAKATGNVIWDWDIASGHTWWSDSLYDHFGHEPDPVQAVPSVWRTNVHPDDEVRVEAAFNRLISDQNGSFSEQYRFRRADGSWAKVEDRAFVVHDADGHPIRVLGSIADISKKQQLEDRLRQAQKMEAVGQLTGGVAHDFNNLLTVILGNTEFLSDELANQPRLQGMAEMTAKAATKGAELTNRLLAFSRQQALEPRVVDASNLVHSMQSMLQRTLPENIDIEFIHTDRLWKIEVDPGQFESALLNLALNARDAMLDGGHLTIEVTNAILADNHANGEHDVEPGHYVSIIVTDTGQGIPRDIIGRIFEPFFTTKEVGTGTGLGLSMIYGFVKQSGGDIRVYSEPGEGTSVKLYFPRSQSRDDHVQLDREGRTIVGGDETILLVEDDNLVREHVIVQLNGLGYRVFDASAGPEALEILNRVPDIDLLFTDVVMPGGMDGRVLADNARALRPELKILFTSGYTENAIVHNGRLDRGVDLLNKPYRRDQLAAKVRQVLDKR